MESYDATGKLRDKVLRLTPDHKIKRRILRVFDESEVRGSPVLGMKELQTLLREKHAEDFARGFGVDAILRLGATSLLSGGQDFGSFDQCI